MNAPPKPDSTQLALDRTWLAHERTLMAWVRTSASMISFGFTIYKFFQFDTKATRPEHVLLSPRNYAVILVATGIITLVAATVQHRKNVETLKPFLETKPRSVAGAMAWLISTLGVLALLAAIFRA